MGNAILFAQNPGSITSKTANPPSGKSNDFIYTPPADIQIPENAKARVLYFNKIYETLSLPLVKKGGGYEFTCETPDSTKVLLIGIVDDKEKILDNNKDESYTVYLYDKDNKLYPGTKSNQASLVNKGGFAAYYLKLNVPATKVLKLYEDEYTVNPAEKDNTYMNYLSLLYKEKKDDAKPEMLNYAQSSLAGNKESNWINALNVYNLLKMTDDAAKTKQKILDTYPKGIYAKRMFWTAFNNIKDPEVILQKKEEFEKTFGDTTAKANFYNALVDLYADKKDWKSLDKYAPFVLPSTLAGVYNNTAWKLSGESLTKPGEQLVKAKELSASSLALIQKGIDNPVNKPAYYKKTEDYVEALKRTYMTYSDTYALILYKLGNSDSAFYYQTIALGEPSDDVDQNERYAVYAYKVKGAAFVKPLIEKQLLAGKGTPGMEALLKTTYKDLGLPEAEYNKIVATSTEKVKQDLAAQIKEKMANYTASDFSLRNLKGENISLASLKGKVVVLDFWATWCGPCKASFPAMQTAVNKYKDDANVAFLFIDTREDKEPQPMKEDAAKFIKDNNYTFHVLLDEKNKVLTNYNVGGIPTKFVIDTKGNVKYTSVGYNGNADQLVEELSAMVENAKKS